MRSLWASGSERIGDLLDRIGPLHVIRRHRLLFASVLVTMLALTLVAYLVLPVRYMATGSVIVAEQEVGIADNSPTASQKIGDPADLESQLLVIRSPRVMRRALTSPDALDALRRECVAAGGAGFGGSCSDIETRPDRLVDYVSTRYFIASVGRSRVINISYQSSQPDIARTMANALINAVLEDQKESASMGRRTAVTWLRQQLKDLDATIRDMDAEIANFRSSKGLVRGASAPIGSERLTSISQQLAVAQAAQAAAAARLKEVRDDRSSGQANSTRVLESRTIADLKQQITDIDVQLAAAEGVLGPMHPRLKTLADQAKLLNSRLAAEVSRISQNAQKEYDTATAQVAALTEQLESAKKGAALAVTDERSIESLVRDVEIKRKQYAELAEKASALEAEERIVDGSLRLVSLAELPLKPFFPKKVPFLAAGLTLGLLLGFAAAFAAERLARDGEEPTPDDGEAVRMPAAIPYMRPASLLDYRQALPSESRSVRMLAVIPYVQPASLLDYGEPLRSALTASIDDQDMRKALDRLAGGLTSELSLRTQVPQLLVTSPSAGGGKTFTTLALACHVAGTGRRVLIIEWSPTGSRISDTLALSGHRGIGDVLRGDADPEDVVRKSPVAGLDVIAAHGEDRTVPRADWEDRLAGLLDWARRYELVLLDGPSADTAEAGLLMKLADAVLVCVDEENLDADSTTSTIADIHAAGHERVGIVVTEAGRPALEERPSWRGRMYKTA